MVPKLNWSWILIRSSFLWNGDEVDRCSSQPQAVYKVRMNRRRNITLVYSIGDSLLYYLSTSMKLQFKQSYSISHCGTDIFLHYAREVLHLRGTLPQHSASSDQAKKLWWILKEHQANRTCSRIFGALDPCKLHRWPSSWTQSMPRDGSAHPRHPHRTNLAPIWQIILWTQCQRRWSICSYAIKFMRKI